MRFIFCLAVFAACESREDWEIYFCSLAAGCLRAERIENTVISFTYDFAGSSAQPNGSFTYLEKSLSVVVVR